MEILPSARCSFICVLAFIKTRMIRKSGYFASVLDSALSRAATSLPGGVAQVLPASRIAAEARPTAAACSRTLLPSPGWQASVFAVMVNTSVLLNSLGSLRSRTFPSETLPARAADPSSGRGSPSPNGKCRTFAAQHYTLAANSNRLLSFKTQHLNNQIATLPSVRFSSFATSLTLKPRPTKR